METKCYAKQMLILNREIQIGIPSINSMQKKEKKEEEKKRKDNR